MADRSKGRARRVAKRDCDRVARRVPRGRRLLLHDWLSTTRPPTIFSGPPLVSTSGGDAQAANIAMQTATPWPRYSNDTNIPANGARIVKAINRYESGSAGAGASDGATPSAANPGGSAGSGPTTGASTRNDGFSSRPILRLLETRRVLSMPERATAKALSLWRDEDGSALVEATIVMPLLISLFLGVFEFSWFFYNQQLVVSGLRDAARYMTRIELTDGNRDPCAQKDQYGALYTDDAANIATTAQPSAGGSARVSGWSAADVTISCVSSAALENGDYADGSASMTIIDVATRFADPSLGLFSDLGTEGADAVLLPSGASS